MTETAPAGGDLIHSVADGIARIIFNRPSARNALTFEMYEGLREICAGMPTDGSVRALILSGAGGRAFASGTDMTQFRAFGDAADALAYEARMEAVISAVERCPVPTVAALTGACTGGGAAIAAVCDIRVADPSLKFGFPIARTLGNCLSAATLRRLSALMGPAKVKEMLLTARLLEAEEMHALGVVAEIAPDPDARATEMAEWMAGLAPLTLRATKEAMHRIIHAAGEVDDRDLIALCYTSADFREGLDAFLSKRKPEWRGEVS